LGQRKEGPTMGQREIFLPFFFFWQHLLHRTAQDKTNKRKMNSKKKSIDRKQNRKKKKRETVTCGQP